MALEIVKEIREAEIEGENTIKRAEVMAKSIVKDAEVLASKEIENTNQKARDKALSIIKEYEVEAQKQAKAIMESSQRICEEISNIPMEKLNEAVNLVIERIVRGRGNS